MSRLQFTVLLLLLAHSASAQNVFCYRVTAHTPFYDRILLSKDNSLRPKTLRGIDDLTPADLYPDTNRLDGIFAQTSHQRTNGLFSSCLAEVPIATLSLKAPGGLLDEEQVRELLRDTVAVPRSSWTNHMGHGGSARYVFSLVGPKREEHVIDERAGSCALVFFPDGTYRCLMGPGLFLFADHSRSRSSESETAGPTIPMKKCSYCGAEYPDDFVECAVDHTLFTHRGEPPVSEVNQPETRSSSFQRVVESVWALRVGVVLAVLPIPAFVVLVVFLIITTRQAQLMPEDLWPVVPAVLGYLWFAGFCLVPSFALLSFHFRTSHGARRALVCAAIETVLILGCIAYVILTA